MTMTSTQQAIYDYLRKQHSDFRSEFVVDVEDLQNHLQDMGIRLEKPDAVGIIVQLQNAKTGLHLEAIDTENDRWVLHLKWRLTPAQRTKLWREEQAKLGRKGRMIFLNDVEHEKVLTFVEEHRSKSK